MMGHKVFMLALGLIVGASWPFVIGYAWDSSPDFRVAGLRSSDQAPFYDYAQGESTSGVDDANVARQATPFTLLGEVAPAVVRVRTASTSGSGVVIDPDGLVLTSAHLVGSSKHVEVIVGDKESLVGNVIRLDVAKDLALLSLPKGEYHSSTLGSEVDIVLGAPIYSIGYPLDMAGPATITSGVVSRYFDATGSRGKIIQTDAAINLGNSGGPIVNGRGTIIGIVSSVAGDGPFSRATGISFAVSVTTIQKHFLN